MTALINTFLRSRIVIWSTLVITLIFVIAAWSTSFYTLNAYVRSIMLWVAVAVLIVYGRFALSAAKIPGNQLQGEDKLIVGISLNWLAILFTCLMLVFWRFAFPNQPLTSDIITYFLLLQVLGGLYHVWAYGQVLRKYIPIEWVTAAIISGGVVTGATIIAGIGWG